MNAGEQRAARGLIEIEHYVAQKNHVETIARAIERQRCTAEIGLAEIAKLTDFVLDGPVFADVVEVARALSEGRRTT